MLSIVEDHVVQVPACPIICGIIDLAKEFELDNDRTIQFG